MNNMLPINKYDLHNVSHVMRMSVMRMEIKLQPQFIFSICFHFTTKIKISILLRVGIKKPAQKNFAASGFFKVFLF